jgi:hypothetical protein
MKLFRIFGLLVFISLLSACHREKKTSGDDAIISKDEMVAVLVDMHLVEAKIKASQTSGYNQEYYLKFYFSSILKKHNITSEQFRKSLQYYQDDVAKMDKIYTDVISNLTMYQARLAAP